MMTDTNNAFAAFLRAQAGMGAAIKSSKNPHFKNSYADLNAIQEAVFPSFHAEGFMITQSGSADEFGRFVDTIAIHVSGERFPCRVYLEYKDGNMQSLGSAITYARRYGLMALTGIPTVDDDGNAATRQPEPPKFNARETADKMIAFFASCTAEQFEAGKDRSAGAIKKIEEHSVPMSLEVKAAMDKAQKRLNGENQ
jgi:hypothetical protein